MRSFLTSITLLFVLLFGISEALAGGGYPTMYCDDPTNPTTCYYVTSTVGAPTTICDSAGNCITLSVLESTFLESVIGLPVKGAMYGWDSSEWRRLAVGLTGYPLISIEQIGGNTINVNGGAIDTGTQTITLATDDPAVTDLAAIGVLTISIESLTTSIEAWNLGTSFADGMNTDAPRVKVAAVAYGYNGATLDMVRVGASKEFHMTDIATRAGEDAANDRRKMGKYYSEGHSPAKTTTATVGTAEEEVLASTEILNWPNVTLYLHNTDGADPFTDAAVYVSPDGVLWIPLTWTSCDTAGYGTGCSFELSGQSYRYIKAGVAAADANPVSVDAWLTANRN
jgi:hypothetical protein